MNELAEGLAVEETGNGACVIASAASSNVEQLSAAAVSNHDTLQAQDVYTDKLS